MHRDYFIHRSKIADCTGYNYKDRTDNKVIYYPFPPFFPFLQDDIMVNYVTVGGKERVQGLRNESLRVGSKCKDPPTSLFPTPSPYNFKNRKINICYKITSKMSASLIIQTEWYKLMFTCTCIYFNWYLIQSVQAPTEFENSVCSVFCIHRIWTILTHASVHN